MTILRFLGGCRRTRGIYKSAHLVPSDLEPSNCTYGGSTVSPEINTHLRLSERYSNCKYLHNNKSIIFDDKRDIIDIIDIDGGEVRTLLPLDYLSDFLTMT